jgi:hypothetical protein
MRYKTKPSYYKPKSIAQLDIFKDPRDIGVLADLETGRDIYHFRSLIEFTRPDASDFDTFLMELLGEVRFTTKPKLFNFDKNNTTVKYEAYVYNTIPNTVLGEAVAIGKTKLNNIEFMMYSREEIVTRIIKNNIMTSLAEGKSPQWQYLVSQLIIQR